MSRRLLLFVSLCWLCACGREQQPAPEPTPPPLPQGPQWILQDIPIHFLDQLDRAALPLAIERQVRWFKAPSNADKVFEVGKRRLSTAQMAATLERFLEIWQRHDSDDQALNDAIAQTFDVYQLHYDGSPDYLMTGYYAPILQGSLKADDQYRFPLYGIPDDMHYLQVDQFHERILGRGPSLRFDRLPVRIEGNKVLPYHARAQIDGDQVLAGRGLELLYLDDYWETFLFHVQGGGFVQLRDGTFAKINYAGQNGQPYRGVGRLLVERGHIEAEELSLQAIGTHLEQYPEQLYELCFQNPSYVFYTMTRTKERSLSAEMYPHGSLGFPVTSTRSIAMDKRYFKGGGLYFIQGAQQVEPGYRPENIKASKVGGFVIDQDTGGAIRGGHFDFFCGAGEQAKALAGKLNDQKAKIYQLVLKETATF